MIVTKECGTRKSERGESHDPGDRLSSQLVSVRGKTKCSRSRRPARGRNCRRRRSKNTGEICVGSLCSSMVRIFPLRRNLERAGRESTLGLSALRHRQATKGGQCCGGSRWALDMLDDFNGYYKPNDVVPSCEAKSTWSNPSRREALGLRSLLNRGRRRRRHTRVIVTALPWLRGPHRGQLPGRRGVHIARARAPRQSREGPCLSWSVASSFRCNQDITV